MGDSVDLEVVVLVDLVELVLMVDYLNELVHGVHIVNSGGAKIMLCQAQFIRPVWHGRTIERQHRIRCSWTRRNGEVSKDGLA